MFSKRKRVVIWMSRPGGLKVLFSVLLVALTVVLLSYDLPSTKTWTYWTMPLSGKLIALDAGHGGPDGGAVSKSGKQEKEVNLAIAMYLRDYLQQAGALVIMTREDDRDLADPSLKGLSKRKTEDLHKRAKLIKDQGAELLVTIHMNAIPSPRWRGAQTFYTDNHEDNKLIAALIQDEIKQNLKNTDRIAKSVDKTVYLLETLKIPGVLVEAGFLSNPDEANLLSKPEYQKKTAAAIYQGILRYYSGEKIEIPKFE